MKNYLEDNSALFEYYITRACEDHNLEVRTKARSCILLYRRCSPLKCADLINYGLPGVLRKDIIEELSLYENETMVGLNMKAVDGNLLYIQKTEAMNH